MSLSSIETEKTNRMMRIILQKINRMEVNIESIQQHISDENESGRGLELLKTENQKLTKELADLRNKLKIIDQIA